MRSEQEKVKIQFEETMRRIKHRTRNRQVAFLAALLIVIAAVLSWLQPHKLSQQIQLEAIGTCDIYGWAYRTGESNGYRKEKWKAILRTPDGSEQRLVLTGIISGKKSAVSLPATYSGYYYVKSSNTMQPIIVTLK